MYSIFGILICYGNSYRSFNLLIMKKVINKKSVSVSYYAKRSLVQTMFFFILLIAWQIGIFNKGIVQAESVDFIYFCFLTAGIILLFASYFEIRTVTEKEERFLGYKAYILFFYKFISIPLVVLTSLLSSYLTHNVFVMILLQSVWFIVYCILFACVMRKYKHYLKSSDGCLFISYQIRVKKWYIEGELKEN